MIEDMAVQELYDIDFFEWTQRNAELLRRGCFEAADIEHIAEELEGLGKRDQREIQNYLTRVIANLLNSQMQPISRTPDWQSVTVESLFELKGIFKQSPSLKRFAQESVAEIYPDAVRTSSIETGLDRKEFPPECPYTFDQLMDPDYLPES